MKHKGTPGEVAVCEDVLSRHSWTDQVDPIYLQALGLVIVSDKNEFVKSLHNQKFCKRFLKAHKLRWRLCT